MEYKIMDLENYFNLVLKPYIALPKYDIDGLSLEMSVPVWYKNILLLVSGPCWE
jgi:hypothetical protein